MNIAQLLANSATAFRDSPAVCLGSRTVEPYGGLARRAAALAGALRSRLTLEPGARVGVCMTNAPEYVEVLFGIWWAGLCAVPINARLHRREVAYILDSAQARLCFVTDDLHDEIGFLASPGQFPTHVLSVHTGEYRKLLQEDAIGLEPRSSDEPAWLFYTSGTTGQPKGATLTHRNLMMMALAYLADITRVTEDATILHAAPLSHGTGLLAVPYVAKGARNVVLESRSLNHDEVLGLLGSHPNICMYHTPTMVKRLIEHPRLGATSLENLDTVFYGGSPMYLADLKLALERLGPRLAQMWAQAETPNTGTCLSKRHHVDVEHPRYLERLSSAGIARTGVEIRIGDADDRDLPAGEIGEILVRGDTVMAGYWNRPDATAETLRNGWLHTGDLGSMDSDGFLTVKDRAKDMIISGGFNIYPREIEEVLLRHPRVHEVSVFGRPHPDLVEEVIACVVTRDGNEIGSEELDALCLDNIARFKRPRAYRFLPELPKSNYGKILKRELRDEIGREQESALAERRR